MPSTESRVLDRVDNDLNLNATAKDGRGSVFYRDTSHARRFRSDKKRGSASKVGQTFSFGQRASQAGSDTHQGTGLDKSWGARRRDPRVNGADLYVVRVTRSGVGNAQPCWRCVRWCALSGVKRIFHWNPKEGKFDMTKVNDESCVFYQTKADTQLFSGATY